MGESRETSGLVDAIVGKKASVGKVIGVVDRLSRLYHGYLYFSNDMTERPYAMMGFGSALATSWIDEEKMKKEDRMAPVMGMLHQKYQTAEEYVREHYGSAMSYAMENFSLFFTRRPFRFFEPYFAEGFLRRALLPYTSSSRTALMRRI